MTITKGPGPAPSIPSPHSPSPAAAKLARSPQLSFVAVFQEQQRAREARPLQPPAATPAAISAATASPVEASPARQLVQTALDADRKVDAILRAAASGKTFSPAELLGLQAQVFRYSQTVEVISRGADKLVGGVKQALSTQV
jgi:hypothetical protein